jgi:hypothetical protein
MAQGQQQQQDMMQQQTMAKMAERAAPQLAKGMAEQPPAEQPQQ